MSLTPILFLVVWTFGTLAALIYGAKFGIYTYIFAFHVSPNHTWWQNLVPDLRYLMIVGLVAFGTAYARKDPNPGEPWHAHAGFKLFLVFIVWLWLLNLWALSDLQMEGSTLFTKHLIIAVTIYWLAKDNMVMIKNIMLGMVLGGAWFGWITMGKTGRVEGAAGAIADANTLGMHAAAMTMIAAMMFLGLQRYYRWIPFLCIPLILNTVIQSGSRGAFVGLLAGGFTAMYFCPRGMKGRFSVYAVLGVILFFMLAHDRFMQRLAETYAALVSEEEQLDGSATSRFEIAAAGWRMALDYPMGVGYKGTALLSRYYMPAHVLSGAGKRDDSARAAHNTIMDALVSYGFVGVTLYVLMHIWNVRQLLWLRRVARARLDPELSIAVAGVAAALVVVLVAGQFTNYVYAEIQFWVMGLLCAMRVLVLRMALAPVAAVTREPALPSEVQRIAGA